MLTIQIIATVLLTTSLVLSFMLLRRKTNKRDIQVEMPPGMDPNFARTIQECFKTGKPVRGYYDEKGEYHTEIIDLGEGK